jgi:hypothetical protein
MKEQKNTVILFRIVQKKDKFKKQYRKRKNVEYVIGLTKSPEQLYIFEGAITHFKESLFHTFYGYNHILFRHPHWKQITLASKNYVWNNTICILGSKLGYLRQQGRTQSPLKCLVHLRFKIRQQISASGEKVFPSLMNSESYVQNYDKSFYCLDISDSTSLERTKLTSSTQIQSQIQHSVQRPYS